MYRPSFLLIFLCVALGAGDAFARDEILVVLPTRSEVLEYDERHDLSDSMREKAYSMRDELEMDVLTTKELDRALRRWAGDPVCRDLKCDLESAAAIGAEILVVSSVTKTRGELLKLTIEVYDLREKGKKRKGRRIGPDRAKKPSEVKSIASGDARMRTYRKLLKQAALGAETVLADAFLMPIEPEPRRDRRGR